MVAEAQIFRGVKCLFHSTLLPGGVNADLFGSDHGNHILRVVRCLRRSFKGLRTNSKDVVVQTFTVVEFILPSKHVTSNGQPSTAFETRGRDWQAAT